MNWNVEIIQEFTNKELNGMLLIVILNLVLIAVSIKVDHNPVKDAEKEFCNIEC